MKLLILPQVKAQQLVKEIEVKTSVISITTTFEDNVKFTPNSNVDKIFRIKVNDVERSTFTNGGETFVPAPTKSDFKGLKDFVDNLDCELLIVHCGAGYSRSAGVAAAINEYLNLGYDIFGDNNFCPNRAVYSCCLKELGTAKTQDYYDDLFR